MIEPDAVGWIGVEQAHAADGAPSAPRLIRGVRQTISVADGENDSGSPVQFLASW